MVQWPSLLFTHTSKHTWTKHNMFYMLQYTQYHTHFIPGWQVQRFITQAASSDVSLSICVLKCCCKTGCDSWSLENHSNGFDGSIISLLTIVLVHSHFSCHIFLFQNIFVDPLTPLVHMKNLNLMVLKRSDLCFETRADTHNHIQNIIFNRSTTKHSLKFDSRLYKFMIEVSCVILFQF